MIEDTEEFSQYPKFNELLKKISIHLTEDHSSKSMQAKYESSKTVLDRERKNFLKARLMQDICEEYSSGPDENHRTVGESLAAAKLDSIVEINSCGQKVSLANVTRQDLAEYHRPDIVKDIMKPVLEEKLKHYKETVYSMCVLEKNPADIILNVQYLNSRIKKLTREIQCKQLRYVNRAGAAMKLYDQVAKERTSPEQKEVHLERVTLLSAESTKLSLMVAHLEATIVSDTYTKSTVNALKEIQTAIDTKKRSLERDKSHSQHILDAYLALGEEFTQLVSDYVELNKQLETYQWALNGLNLKKSEPN